MNIVKLEKNINVNGNFLLCENRKICFPNNGNWYHLIDTICICVCVLNNIKCTLHSYIQLCTHIILQRNALISFTLFLFTYGHIWTAGTWGVRHFIIGQLFVAVSVAYALRVNLSVAIVAMTDKNSANPDFEVSHIDIIKDQRTFYSSASGWFSLYRVIHVEKSRNQESARDATYIHVALQASIDRDIFPTILIALHLYREKSAYFWNDASFSLG